MSALFICENAFYHLGQQSFLYPYVHEIMGHAADILLAEHLHIAFAAVARGHKLVHIISRKSIPFLCYHIGGGKAPAAADIFKGAVQVSDDALLPLTEPVCGNGAHLAHKQLSAAGSLGSEQIFHLVGKSILQLCIYNREDVAYSEPVVKRRLIKGVKELIHIKNTRRLHYNTVKVLHTEGDELGLETALVAVGVAAARYHFQLAAVAFKVLEYHHININSTEVIFENGDLLAAVDKVAGIFPDKSGFSRAEDTCDKIYFSRGFVYRLIED